MVSANTKNTINQVIKDITQERLQMDWLQVITCPVSSNISYLHASKFIVTLCKKILLTSISSYSWPLLRSNPSITTTTSLVSKQKQLFLKFLTTTTTQYSPKSSVQRGQTLHCLEEVESITDRRLRYRFLLYLNSVKGV